jgi:hypothetical protein
MKNHIIMCNFLDFMDCFLLEKASKNFVYTAFVKWQFFLWGDGKIFCKSWGERRSNIVMKWEVSLFVVCALVMVVVGVFYFVYNKGLVG